MNPLKLNQVPLEELQTLLPLVRAYHQFEGITLDDVERQEVLQRLLAEPELGRIWFIELDGTVIGYIALCFGFSIEFAGRDAFVDEFFIVESYRGQGIGRQALALVVEEAEKLDIRAVHLEVSEENARAQSLYRSQGFDLRHRFHLMTRKIGNH